MKKNVFAELQITAFSQNFIVLQVLLKEQDLQRMKL